MEIIRKALVRMRREYNSQPKRLFMYSGIPMVVLIAICVVVDLIVPMDNWIFTLIRSLLLMLTASSMFIFGYAVGLMLHYSQLRSNPEWVPFRARVSPTWRRRMALIIVAVLLVLIYGAGGGIGYTLVSSASLAIGIALLAFIRTTVEEAEREKFDLPDDRDTSYHRRLEVLRKEREQKMNAKKAKKKKDTTVEM